MSKTVNKTKKISFLYRLSSILIIAMVMMFSNIVNADSVKGDRIVSKDYEISEEEQQLNNQKIEAMNKWLFSRISGSAYINLDVPTCPQEKSYFCGPATVQQTLKFYKSSVPSQSNLAKQLGTTTDGTILSNIPGVLNNNLGYKQYSKVAIGTQTDWINKVTYSLSIDKPVILDIKAVSGSGWSYTTAGHYLNVSGYDRRTSTHKTKITDPYQKKLGNTWYKTSLVYKVNNAHSLKMMIW